MKKGVARGKGRKILRPHFRALIWLSERPNAADMVAVFMFRASIFWAAFMAFLCSACLLIDFFFCCQFGFFLLQRNLLLIKLNTH